MAALMTPSLSRNIALCIAALRYAELERGANQVVEEHVVGLHQRRGKRLLIDRDHEADVGLVPESAAVKSTEADDSGPSLPGQPDGLQQVLGPGAGLPGAGAAMDRQA